MIGVDSMQKKILLAFFFVSVTVFGYYLIPELPEMVEKSDSIVYGTVSKRHPAGNNGFTTVIRALIKPEKVFKGNLNTKNELVVYAPTTDPAKANLVEDPFPAFPEKGEKVLLFLVKQEAGFTLTFPLTGAYRFTKNGDIFPPPLFSMADLENATKKGR